MEARGSFSALSDNVKSDFLKLATKLSPENLSCDGELSRAQTDAAYQKLMGQWRQLEERHSISVTDEEVMQWYMGQRLLRRSSLSM